MMENEIIRIMAEVFNVPEKNISEKIQFGRYQKWDSLAHINLIVKLEDHFDVSIEPEEISEMIDIPSMLKIIDKKVSK